MHIKWNEQTVRWFNEASDFTGYNKKLASALLDLAPCRDSMCDLGCGAGLIDFELAPYFKNITCVDISKEAIALTKKGALRRGIGNIRTVCADASHISGQWDTVIALFHGGTDVYSKYLKLAKDRLILAVHSDRKGSFGPEDKKLVKCSDTALVKNYLDAAGISYHLKELALEYGQPFRCREDAKIFVRTYSRPMRVDELEAYLDESLEKTESVDFPYYLPKLKRIGIFAIRRNENENF